MENYIEELRMEAGLNGTESIAAGKEVEAGE